VLSDDVSRIAAAALAFVAEGETVTAVLATELVAGERTYLCAFEHEKGLSWLALDADGKPVTSRVRLRDAVSIAALCEVADEATGADRGSSLRLASPSYLDGAGADAQHVAGAIQGAMTAVEELADDVEANYKLELS
jgi:hypothetical protein